jgi:hypothetical protein
MFNLPVRQHHKLIAYVFVIVLATILRFAGLDWDEGYLLHPDERNLVVSAGNLAFPDHLIPDFNAYNGLSVYLPRLLAEAFHLDRDMGGLLKLSSIAWAARCISALFSVCAIFAIYFATQALFNRSTARWAAIMTIFAPGLIQAAHFGTTESALFLSSALCVAIGAHFAAGKIGWPQAAVSFGIAIGLALGFKTTAASLGVIPFVLWIMNFERANWMKPLFWLVISGLIALALFVSTTPQLLFNPESYFRTMQFEGGVVSGAIDVFWTYQFYQRTHFLFEISQISWVIGPICAGLVLPGFFILAAKSQVPGLAWRNLIPFGVFLMVYGFVICSWYAKFIRYLIPVLPIVIIVAAVGVQKLIERCSGMGRQLLVLVLALGIMVPGLSQAAIYFHRDPRVVSLEWLSREAATDDIILIEPGETSPSFALAGNAGLQLVTLPLIDQSSAAKQVKISTALSTGNWIAVFSRRNYAVLPRMHDRFPEMCGYYRALWSGAFGYKVVKYLDRKPGLLGLYDPSDFAEETFSVFDHPRVYVLKNMGHQTAPEILQRWRNLEPHCS